MTFEDSAPTGKMRSDLSMQLLRCVDRRRAVDGVRTKCVLAQRLARLKPHASFEPLTSTVDQRDERDRHVAGFGGETDDVVISGLLQFADGKTLQFALPAALLSGDIARCASRLLRWSVALLPLARKGRRERRAGQLGGGHRHFAAVRMGDLPDDEQTEADVARMPGAG